MVSVLISPYTLTISRVTYHFQMPFERLIKVVRPPIPDSLVELDTKQILQVKEKQVSSRKCGTHRIGELNASSCSDGHRVLGVSEHESRETY